MDINQRLTNAMYDGWNIHIECKANYRNYPLTYEAQMSNADIKKLMNHMDNGRKTHAYGQTMEELLTELLGDEYLCV